MQDTAWSWRTRTGLSPFETGECIKFLKIKSLPSKNGDLTCAWFLQIHSGGLFSLWL